MKAVDRQVLPPTAPEARWTLAPGFSPGKQTDIRMIKPPTGAQAASHTVNHP